MSPILTKNFPEMTELEELLGTLGSQARVKILGEVKNKDLSFPLYTVSFGLEDPTAPVLALFAGVHGLERIGSRVLIAYLKTFAALLSRDESLHEMLKRTRVVMMPIINPMGMYLGVRSNANGVDLMRNAPVDAEGLSKLFLMGGHRLTNRLPWYRGRVGTPMELESSLVVELVHREIFQSRVAISLDVHSGYGSLDRLWFPYAKSKAPFPNVTEMFALKELLDRTFPNHVYQVEPQSKEYTTHGDLWDYLYDQYRAQENPRVYLPLSLEMGSWVWIKKNPKQLFTAVGAFNPLVHHRTRRTLRRHLQLFDFLLRATHSFKQWTEHPELERAALKNRAHKLWYDEK